MKTSKEDDYKIKSFDTIFISNWLLRVVLVKMCGTGYTAYVDLGTYWWSVFDIRCDLLLVKFSSRWHYVLYLSHNEYPNFKIIAVRGYL